MKKYFTLLLVLIFLSQVNVSAQKKKIDFDLDYTNFVLNDSLNLVEVYYSFSQNDFKHAADAYLSAQLHIQITPKGKTEAIVSKNYALRVKPSSDSTSTSNFVGLLKFGVPVGTYELSATLKDLNDSLRSGSVAYSLTSPKYIAQHFSVSEIEFANNLVKSEDTASIFYKNTYDIIPNPTNVYGEKFPVLFYYAELYNINVDPGTSELKIDATVFNTKNISVIKKSKLASRSNKDIVLVDAVNINKIPTGTYTFQLTVSDSIKKTTAVQRKKFFVYNPSFVDTLKENSFESKYLSSEFAGMNEEDVEETFMFSKFIATRAEVNKWDRLSELEAKKNFLYQFWTSRDNIPETPENEFKQAYFKRVIEANLKFGTLRRKGWTTERGRVFLTYGEPSQIDRYPNETDTRPYEIWQYDELEGGAQFVFADLTGFSDYSLIHSTKRGELSDVNWKRRVQMVGSSTDENSYPSVNDNTTSSSTK